MEVDRLGAKIDAVKTEIISGFPEKLFGDVNGTRTWNVAAHLINEVPGRPQWTSGKASDLNVNRYGMSCLVVGQGKGD